MKMNLRIRRIFPVLLAAFLLAGPAHAAKDSVKIFSMVEDRNVSAEEIKKTLSKNYYMANETRGNDKESVLMAALKADRELEVVKVLLWAGADPNGKDKSKRTPIMYGCRFSSDPEIVEELLEASVTFSFRKKKRILQEDKEGKNSFDFAVMNENRGAKESILAVLEKYAENPLKAEENAIAERNENSEDRAETTKIPDSSEEKKPNRTTRKKAAKTRASG